MLRHLVAIHQTQQWTGELFAITADLGRIEWLGTIEHIRAVCTELNIRLVVVRRRKGSMIDRWDERRQVPVKQQRERTDERDAIARQKEGDKPFWSNSTARYYTKELKTAEVNRYLRRFKSVVCAVGIRAEESSSRAKKQYYQIRNDITTTALKAGRGLNAEEHEAWAEAAMAMPFRKGNRTVDDSNYQGRLALTSNGCVGLVNRTGLESTRNNRRGTRARRTLYQSGSLMSALRGWPAHWAY